MIDKSKIIAHTRVECAINRTQTHDARNVRAREGFVYHATENEKFIERYLGNEVKRLGGVSLKFFSATQTGYPDRIVMMPDGTLIWVELKRPGGKPRPLQLYRHDQLRSLGQEVWVIDSREGVDLLLARWRR